ncbi:MAG: hypothetical protein AAGJ78_10240 [Pseudomonadota bacterium]
MVSENNPKMRDRLKWIDTNNSTLVDWLEGYLKKGRWPDPTDSKNGAFHRLKHGRIFIDSFINDALTWPENADTREQCRQIHAAWKAKEKRVKNENKMFSGTYTLTKSAKAELMALCKQQGMSGSNILNHLLLRSKSIHSLENKLKTLIKANERKKIDTTFLSSFFQDDLMVNTQVNLAVQALKTEKNQLQQKVMALETQLTSLKAELEKAESQVTETNDH